MNNKLLYGLVLGAAAVTACTEDYKDWVDPQTNAQEETVTFGNGSVASVETIYLSAVDSTYVKVCSITDPTSSSDSYTPAYTITLSTDANLIDPATYELTEDGYMLTEDLVNYLEGSYGKRPVERTLNASISVWETSEAASVMLSSAAFTIVSVPEAPEIEKTYYLTGNFNGWDNTNTDFVLSNGGLDPYENPEYTCTFSIPADKVEAVSSGLEFKVTPASGLGGDWSGCLAAADTEGKFNYNNDGGNFSVAYDADAKFYSLTFNMLDQTWESKTLNFNEFIYEIGNESDWSTSHALYSPNMDGIYTGIYYLNGQFKFKPNENDWNGDWECSGSYTLTENGSDNCPAPESAGMYLITVDLTTMTYSLKSMTFALIGDFNSWGGDLALTYDETSGSLKATGVQLLAGSLKIRANGAWDDDWGKGSNTTTTTNGDVTTVTNLVYKGDNIDNAAGIFDVELQTSYDGNHKLIFTKTGDLETSFSDYVYYAGNANGWSSSASPLAHLGLGAYQGFYYVNGEFKIVDTAWYGDAGDGKLGSGNSYGNISGVSTGFYQFDVNMDELTYKLTEITKIGIIGSAVNGDTSWSTEADMTYDAEHGYWTWTGALTQGEFKFRANGSWDISWGGSLDALTTKNGSNITIGANGTYTIHFTPNCNDKGVATIQ